MIFGICFAKLAKRRRSRSFCEKRTRDDAQNKARQFLLYFAPCARNALLAEENAVKLNFATRMQGESKTLTKNIFKLKYKNTSHSIAKPDEARIKFSMGAYCNT